LAESLSKKNPNKKDDRLFSVKVKELELKFKLIDEKCNKNLVVR